MELGLELGLYVRMDTNEPCFYPCFNGIRVGTHTKNKALHLLIWVSILVLMELGLEHKVESNFNGFTLSFYPCFNGIRVGTVWGRG